MKTNISIPIEVTLNDPDTSESFVTLVLANSVPSGSRLFAGTTEVFPTTRVGFVDQVYEISQMAIEDGQFNFLPPGNYSSALQGDIILETITVVTDNHGGVPISTGPNQAVNITVEVTGVADDLPSFNITIPGIEDVNYDFGTILDPLVTDISRDVSDNCAFSGILPPSLSHFHLLLRDVADQQP
jgi:hypothetical protein